MLSESPEPLGSITIARELERYGIFLSQKAVRYHLKVADERGYTVPLGRNGRMLTPDGMEELTLALAPEQVGFILKKPGSVVVLGGCIGLATVCSVAINGVLLKSGVPVSKFGGVLDLLCQHIVPRLVTTLDVHHPQIGGFCGGRPASTGTKPLPERSEKPVVIKELVHLAQLLAHLEEFRR